MLGIIFPLIITYFIYKNAKENGRNAVLWAVINLIIFFGIQITIGFAIGVFTYIGVEFWGWSNELLSRYYSLFNVLGLACAGLGSYCVFRYITRISDSQFYEPPPPPQFD